MQYKVPILYKELCLINYSAGRPQNLSPRFLLSLGHLKVRFHDTHLLADFGLSYPRISIILWAK